MKNVNSNASVEVFFLLQGASRIYSAHIKNHIGWEDVFKQLEKDSVGGRIKQVTMDMFHDRKSLCTRNWIDHYVTFNLPLTISNDKEYCNSRNPLRFDTISFATLKTRIYQVTREVEIEIYKKLKMKKVGLVFD